MVRRVGKAAGLFLTDFRYVTQVAEQVPASWDRAQARQELLGRAGRELARTGPELARVGFDDEA